MTNRKKTLTILKYILFTFIAAVVFCCLLRAIGKVVANIPSDLI